VLNLHVEHTSEGSTRTAAVVQHSGPSLHSHFNHNALNHVIEMAGIYLFYRGARLPGDR
jgi:hypothetical protein